MAVDRSVRYAGKRPDPRLGPGFRAQVLDQASTTNETIGFRYALGEFCDALRYGDRDRLVRLRAEAALVEVRSRAWIPVEMFFEAIDLPLPPMPAQWLEEFDVVKQRWAGHLSAYLARHKPA